MSFINERNQLTERLFKVSNADFEALALEVFRFQYKYNEIYRSYAEYLGISINKVETLTQIPFLPIEVFKTHKVITGDQAPIVEFKSSGTTGVERSTHYVTDVSLYERISTAIFSKFYGAPEDYVFLALVPSYMENKQSSLLYMINHFSRKSGSNLSMMIANDYDYIINRLDLYHQQSKKVLLIGVSFALLDLAEKGDLDLSNWMIMETGGMKGRRKELLREDLHTTLKEKFSVDTIHSEYGMTELLSQAYSQGKGIFSGPDWMKILIRDLYDPFQYVKNGTLGGINIIDLGNINSCSFIETKDIGRVFASGNHVFEVLGRVDHSDLRGCNLLLG